MFKKGYNKMLFAYGLRQEYLDFDILRKDASFPSLQNIQHQEPRRINSSKKAKILKELLKLMPVERQHFWKGLPSSDSSKDLLSRDQN